MPIGCGNGSSSPVWVSYCSGVNRRRCGSPDLEAENTVTGFPHLRRGHFFRVTWNSNWLVADALSVEDCSKMIIDL